MSKKAVGQLLMVASCTIDNQDRAELQLYACCCPSDTSPSIFHALSLPPILRSHMFCTSCTEVYVLEFSSSNYMNNVRKRRLYSNIILSYAASLLLRGDIIIFSSIPPHPFHTFPPFLILISCQLDRFWPPPPFSLREKVKTKYRYTHTHIHTHAFIVLAVQARLHTW